MNSYGWARLSQVTNDELGKCTLNVSRCAIRDVAPRYWPLVGNDLRSCISLQVSFVPSAKEASLANHAKIRIRLCSCLSFCLNLNLPYSQFVPFHPEEHSHWGNPSSLTVQLPLLWQGSGESTQGDPAKQRRSILWVIYLTIHLLSIETKTKE